MAERDAEIVFKKDTVHKLLSGFFKEEKTKRELYKSCPDLSDFPQTVCILVVILSLNKSLCVTVSGDAALLMAEMLKIFVEEAAVRSQKQAESEDCDEVEIEHFEKILPQLLLDF
uniref:Centromere protein X n=1 Tax=Lates calcarifer TaxID=8187 RepID=A0A4W6G1D6_LATCA